MIFAFDRKGNPIDINDVIKDCKKWSLDYWQDCILINDTTSSPYLWYRDDGEEEKVNSRKINDLLKATFTALKPYDKKKGSPQRFTLETVHQPESICMARQRRMKNGEICLTIYSWENGKDQKVNLTRNIFQLNETGHGFSWNRKSVDKQSVI